VSFVDYWFDYDDRYLPAIILAAIVILIGIFAFLFATKNVYRKSVLGIWIVLIAVCIGMVVAGFSSRHYEQPPYVREILLVTGFISTCITIPLFFVIRFYYEKATIRKMRIKDLLDN
jgi:hypothetical protein